MDNEHIERFLPHVYRFATYMLRDHHHAQDITQETMLRAIQTDGCIQDTKAWLLRVAANLCKDQLRRRRIASRNPGNLSTDPVGNAPEPWFRMLQQESCQELEKTIESLTDREKRVLYLSAFEQLTNPEIAQVLEMSTGAVKVALSRARNSVRQAILVQNRREAATSQQERSRGAG